MSDIEPKQYTLKTGESVIVRTARPDDAANLLEIHVSVTQEGEYLLREADEIEWDEVEERKRIQRSLDNPAWLYLVAEGAGAVVGFVDFTNGNKRRTAHTGQFGIEIQKAWRGKGLGTILLGALLDWATHQPVIEKVTLTVFSTNLRAIRLYEKLGFQEEGRRPKETKLASGEYIDHLLMYKFVR